MNSDERLRNLRAAFAPCGSECRTINAVEDANDSLDGVLKNNINFNEVKGKTKIPDQTKRARGLSVRIMTECETDSDQTWHGSLHALRGEYEGVRLLSRERRADMPQAQVTMDVRKVNDDVSVIDVKGELTAFAEGVLMDAYSQASDGGVRAIVLNFEGLEYMNSSGIELLVALLIRVNREKQRLLTYGLSEHYRNIFQITRLDDAIGIYDSEEEAVRAGAA